MPRKRAEEKFGITTSHPRAFVFTASVYDTYLRHFFLSLPLTGQRISIWKDGSIPCEHADFTAAVSLPGDVQCGLI